jgi:hypothetical protein
MPNEVRGRTTYQGRVPIFEGLTRLSRDDLRVRLTPSQKKQFRQDQEAVRRARQSNFFISGRRTSRES